MVSHIENVSSDMSRKTKIHSSSSAHFSSILVLRTDNWISSRVTLVCPSSRRDIPSADSTVSFGGGSEAQEQKWDFQLFSVKLPVTPCDTKSWRIAPPWKEKQHKVMWGLWSGEAAAAAATCVQKIPLFLLCLIPVGSEMNVWMCLVLSYSGSFKAKGL